MEIRLSFSEKPKSASKEMAIRIARQCGAKYENERYFVTFNNVSDSFKKLVAICGSWKATELVIDNKECNGVDFHALLNCYRQNRCDGICDCNFFRQEHRYYLIIHRIERLNSDVRFGYIDYRPDPELDAFIEKVDDSTLAVNKTGLLEAILRDSEIPLLLCEKCTQEKIRERINALPDVINLDSESEPSNIRIFRRSFHIDDEPEDESDEDDGLSQYDIARYTAIAEMLAPILAREIAKELSRYLPNDGRPKTP